MDERERELQDEEIRLRDWFAGQALAGILAYYNPVSGDAHTNWTAENTAVKCYIFADAMMKARSAPNE